MAEEGDSNEKQTLVDGEVVSTVNVKCSNGSKFSVKTNLESTVESFKVLVSQNCDVPTNQQLIIYNGRILNDDQTLISYGLQADHCVHMVRGSANSGSQNLTYEEMMTTPAYQSLMNNPGLTRILIMSNTQLREVVDHNPELGDVLNNTNILRQTLEASRNPQNPAMSQMLQSLISSTQYMNQIMILNTLIRSLIDSYHIFLNQNPDFLHQNPPPIRQMMQNPDFLHFIFTSETIQQSTSSENQNTSSQITEQTGNNNEGLDILMAIMSALNNSNGNNTEGLDLLMNIMSSLNNSNAGQ